MKKNILKSAFLLAIIGGLSVACNVEPVPQPDAAETVVTGLEFCASHAGVQTKTSLGAEPDYNVLWSAGDQISVNGILSNAVAEEDHNKTSVRFRVEGDLAVPFNVLYPGTTEKNVIVLPATQNYFADNYDPAAYAAYGEVVEENGDFSATLNNFCGLVRFALNGSATLSKIEVNALGGEKLHGTFTLADAFDGTFTGGTAGTLTYNFGEGLTLSKTDTYVYIALPAQTYAAGVEAKVYQADGAFMRLKFWGDDDGDGEGEVLAGSDLRAFASKTYAAGRTENLVEAGKLEAEDGGMPNVPAGVTVALFNTMRFDEEFRPSAMIDKSDNAKALYRPYRAIASSNEAMREAFGKVIYNTQADIIGFTEVDDNMNDYTDANSIEKLAEAQGCNYTYKFFSSGISDDPLDVILGRTEQFEFANGFAYNPDVLTLNDSGRAWYNSSGTTNYSTSSDDNSGNPNRTYVWAKFTHKASGKQFYFFVTQLPNDTGNNTKAANGINNFAASKAGSLPHILVGDMNNADHEKDECQEGAQKLKEYWTDVYDALDMAGTLPSFYKTYPGTQSGTGKDYHYSLLDFCNNHPERRIDKIMTKGACSPTSYKTIRNTYTVPYEGIGYKKSQSAKDFKVEGKVYISYTDEETKKRILESAESGEYKAGNKIIVVVDGQVSEIKDLETDEEGKEIVNENVNKTTLWVEEEVDEDVACYPSDHLALVSYITLD